MGQALIIGIVAGSGYSLIALGLVLVYKSSGIFNFAPGEFGTVPVYGLWGALFLVPHLDGLTAWLEDAVQRDGNVDAGDVRALVVTDSFADVAEALDAVEHRRPRRAPRKAA